MIKSLRGKTIIGVATIEIVLLAILIVTVVGFLTQIIDDLLIKRAETTASLFATTTKDALISFDLATLEDFVDELMANPDLAYVRVIGRDGQPLAQRGQEQVLSRPFSQDQSLADVDDEVFDTYKDVMQGEYVFGRIELGIHIAQTQQAIAKVRNWSVSIAAVELGLVALFSFILGSYLTKQLSALLSGSKKVKNALNSGDFEHVKVPIRGDDELAELSISFNELITSLDAELARTTQQQKELRQLNESLENKVQQRTAALSERNAELVEANKTIKEAQQQLLQAEKMASVGQLAAGIAHEINTPLGFVGSNFSTLGEYISVYQHIIQEVEKFQSTNVQDVATTIAAIKTLMAENDIGYINEDIQDLLTESTEGLDRVAEIVSGLKVFSRADNNQKQLCSLNDCVQTTLKMVNNELKFNCEVHTQLGALPDIEMNLGKMSQVITNLLINASQAVQNTGTFGRIEVTTFAQDEHVVLQIKDTGEGIPEHDMKELFNPFFTTKKEGEGTGLGLSISHGIVVEHQGEIAVDSTVGKGSIFTVRLPISQMQTERGNV